MVNADLHVPVASGTEDPEKSLLWAFTQHRLH